MERKFWKIFGVAGLAAGVLLSAGTASAVSPVDGGDSGIDGRMHRLEVYSAAMDRDVPVTVMAPSDPDQEAGVFYLLDGNSGQTEGNNWLVPGKGGAAEFFADQDVYAVFPTGGTGTLYTDWQDEHPEYGTVKWETFLTEELPVAIEQRFTTNGRRAIGGISSGAQGALLLAARSPGMYDAVAGYSGCYDTSSEIGRAVTELTVLGAGVDSDQMWGPPEHPDWHDHDLFAHADGLRGADVYLSAGTGLPGPHETLDTPQLERRIVIGGLLEAGSNACTQDLVQTLRGHDVNVVHSAPPVGAHDWPYWRDELARSWPVIGARLQ